MEPPAKRLCKDHGNKDEINWLMARVYKRTHGYAYTNTLYSRNTLVVDKTLICKAFLETEHKNIRICVPECFGKTFNLSVIADFFNVITKHDMPRSDNAIIYKHHKSSAVFDSSVAQDNRMKLFEGSLLLQEQPNFFHQHFGRYPVVYINFGMEDINEWDSFSQRLAWFLSYAIDRWVDTIDYKKLSHEQKHEFSKMCTMKDAWLKEIDYDDPEHDHDKWAHYSDTACNILASISKCLTNFDCHRFIFLADNYDVPLKVLHSNSWATQAEKAYVGLLRGLLASNIFIKCMVVGTFCYPLKGDNECDISDMISISLNSNRILQRNNDNQVNMTRLETVTSMFGFTAAQVTELAKVLETQDSNFKSSLEHVVESALYYSGGYNFGTKNIHYNQFDIYCFLKKCKKNTAQTTHLSLSQSIKIHAVAKSLAYDRNAELIMLTSKLIHDFDTNNSSCVILQEDCLDYYNSQSAEYKMTKFILQPEFVPDSQNNLSKINDFVNLMLHTGYLNINNDNVLCIPSGKYRNMWEKIQLLATFGTLDRITQDDQRYQLIDSLYNGNIDVLLKTFRSGLMELHFFNPTFSYNMKIELICRYFICMLTMPRYHIISRPNIEYDYSFFSQLHFGRSQWEVDFVPFGRYAQKLVLVFYIAHFAAENLENIDQALDQLAQCCLEKIVCQDGARFSENNNLRIELGIAIGNNNVAVCHKCYGDFEVN
ncbi:hypothetical protein COEREDRAFT_82915 [Coemansia reversa NRRL 1564]|uniref:Uncharacterized protein n=1 Tax=Coemansia reversa (strain ATCC 12441 / NRRL 1564) TaxID=763665 RepID=A0A2G5B5H9_COERN|nr:hypothetical protein COEREDRAFT_82915 [Coemansia reversa NRRL 1564]|eukprot:PIA14254.1 hypothetical protein COEREDRAFT_82915 [Coemansia reversa NRRL 1564]